MLRWNDNNTEKYFCLPPCWHLKKHPLQLIDLQRVLNLICCPVRGANKSHIAHLPQLAALEKIHCTNICTNIFYLPEDTLFLTFCDWGYICAIFIISVNNPISLDFDICLKDLSYHFL